MQTFLPYVSFIDSAKCIDDKRCGKQRVEAMQIVNCLNYRDADNLYMIDKNGKRRLRGWINHSAVLMWEGYTEALKLYCNIFIIEWTIRGFKNNMPLYTIDFNSLKLPPWLGNVEFHESHRSNLLRKNYEHYSKFNWNVPNDLSYVWFKMGGKKR